MSQLKARFFFFFFSSPLQLAWLPLWPSVQQDVWTGLLRSETNWLWTNSQQTTTFWDELCEMEAWFHGKYYKTALPINQGGWCCILRRACILRLPSIRVHLSSNTSPRVQRCVINLLGETRSAHWLSSRSIRCWFPFWKYSALLGMAV